MDRSEAIFTITATDSEIGNVTSKCKGVTSYRLSPVLRKITLGSDNGSNFDRAINLRRNNGFHVR
jgi:hypothetical protein